MLPQTLTLCSLTEGGSWHQSSPLPLLPFFSMASTSLSRSGGAISGGVNCSDKSGSSHPDGDSRGERVIRPPTARQGALLRRVSNSDPTD